MNSRERESIVAELPYESRLGFIAFCVDRCLVEARRHRIPSEELPELPELPRGVDLLWLRAERDGEPDAAEVDSILDRLATYESPAPDGEHALYNHDLTLVHAARMLTKGMRLLENPAESARYVAGASAGPAMSVGLIYRDWQGARAKELAIIDEALTRLRDWGERPFSKQVLEGISDWERGEVRPQYAEGRIKGTSPEWEE